MSLPPNPSSDRSEADRLRDTIRITIQAFVEFQGYELASTMQSLVDDLYSKGEIRGLRILSRDIDRAAETLDPSQLLELERRLAHLGLRRANYGEGELPAMKRALARGRVASEKERRRIENYLDFLAATGSEPSLRRRLERLLTAD